jgi:hypothetical protein
MGLKPLSHQLEITICDFNSSKSGLSGRNSNYPVQFQLLIIATKPAVFILRSRYSKFVGASNSKFVPKSN